MDVNNTERIKPSRVWVKQCSFRTNPLHPSDPRSIHKAEAEAQRSTVRGWREAAALFHGHGGNDRFEVPGSQFHDAGDGAAEHHA